MGTNIKNRLAVRLKQAAQTASVVLLFSLAADYWRRPTVPAGAALRPVALIGRAVPVTLAEAGGSRTLVLYFWGSWCGVCRHTSPAVQRLKADGIPVLGVATASGSDAEVAAYLRRHGWDFETANDADGTWTRQWQVRVTPTVLLVKNGKVVHSTAGIASYPGLRARVWLADILGG